MSAARRRAQTVPDLPVRRVSDPQRQMRAHLLNEALDALMDPMTREELLRRANWDVSRAQPQDTQLGIAEWIDRVLYPLLGARLGLAGADEARRQVRALLVPASEPPASLFEEVEIDVDLEDLVPDEATPAASSGVRQVRRKKTGPIPTLIPRASGCTVLVWTEDDRAATALQHFMGARADLRVARSVEATLSRLRLCGDDIALVLMDRRVGEDEELRLLSSGDLADHQVVVWGPRTLDTPSYQRLVCEADRAVGCTAEADLQDVADLCLVLLGLADV
ncbi:MAG: hypothetical protein VYE22_06080 [Myxococcota bacterium]|nr:hypothetical protein [Myxococcota bacterium]